MSADLLDGIKLPPSAADDEASEIEAALEQLGRNALPMDCLLYTSPSPRD